jgi:hypothetical protein
MSILGIQNVTEQRLITHSDISNQDSNVPWLSNDRDELEAFIIEMSNGQEWKVVEVEVSIKSDSEDLSGSCIGDRDTL